MITPERHWNDMKTLKEQEAARIVETATKTAQDLIDKSTIEAENVVTKAKHDLHASLVEIVQDALGREPTRYFDTSRIPLLCKAIFNIEENLKSMKTDYVNRNEFLPIKSIVYGGAGIVLTAVLTAGIALIIVNK